jgi:hypothetical protein
MLALAHESQTREAGCDDLHRNQALENESVDRIFGVPGEENLDEVSRYSSPDEVRMANDANAKIGWEATITSVNFRVRGSLTLVGREGKRIKRRESRTR